MDSTKIVQVAKKYLGKEEKPSNTGWKDSEFERRMKEVGWLMGQAWCAYFVELSFKEAYPEEYKKLERCFDASAVKTFQKFKEAGYPISQTPVVGSIVVWQTQKSGKPHWTGHAAVCSEVIDDKTFKSIEGNTSASGSREGYIVAEKLRKIQKVTNGLQVLGFIKLTK
jgi:hypothetical protein